MKQKKWLISICALDGLLVLCVGVYTVLVPSCGDISGVPEGTPANSETFARFCASRSRSAGQRL